MAIYKKRARRDLNPRPTEPESVALSTEPRALDFLYYSTFVIGHLSFVISPLHPSLVLLVLLVPLVPTTDNWRDLQACHRAVLQNAGEAL